VNQTSTEETQPLPQLPRKLLFLVSGPAGSGKTTLCRKLLEEFPSLERAVTATTRPERPGEAHGEDYYFFTQSEFHERQSKGEFLEWATVHDRLYGTLKSEVSDRIHSGKDVLLNIDVQGMMQIRESFQKDFPSDSVSLVSVFIQPPSIQTLVERMKRRNTDDPAEIERRVQTACTEINLSHYFQYIIHSGTEEEDYDDIRSIYKAEKRKSNLARCP